MRSQLVRPPRNAASSAWARLGPTFSCQFADIDAGRWTDWDDGRPIRVVRRSRNEGDKDEGRKAIAGRNDNCLKLVAFAPSIAPGTALKGFFRFARWESERRPALGSGFFPVAP